MKPKVKISSQWLEKFCKEHHIIKLALYGSVVSNHFTDASDVDILVEFAPNHTPGFFRFVDIKDALAENLGREVDLRTPEDISTLFRNEVMQQSYLIYGEERFKLGLCTCWMLLRLFENMSRTKKYPI